MSEADDGVLPVYPEPPGDDWYPDLNWDEDDDDEDWELDDDVGQDGAL